MRCLNVGCFAAGVGLLVFAMSGPALAQDGPVGPMLVPPDGQIIEGEIIELYPHVEYEDRDEIAPDAIEDVFAVYHPELCCDVYILICRPPCDPVEIERDDDEVKINYGEYEIEIEFDDEVVLVEYSD